MCDQSEHLRAESMSTDSGRRGCSDRGGDRRKRWHRRRDRQPASFKMATEPLSSTGRAASTAICLPSSPPERPLRR